ncbi:MAG: KamA family radical SAM protein [Lentisphaerae bacterium]|nr:KamA family radical SAM protein [Lentisphaerota bacterium]
MNIPKNTNAANGAPDAEWQDWRWQMQKSPSGLPGLAGCLDAQAPLHARYETLLSRYPFRVTPYYASIGETVDASNPVGRQYLPQLEEVDDGGEDFEDPFDEEKQMPVRGIVHRYRNRVVAVVTDRCAVNCRHCTRKNTIRSQGQGGIDADRLQGMVDYVMGTKTIREVIVSGGDPLVLDTGVLDRFLGSLRRIPHVEVLRLGTRVPVVLPMRIDEDLCAMLARHRPLWVNTQFNHPAELTEDALSACDSLMRRGIPVSNQCVLLRGINDDFETMRTLCNGLQARMIRPYYVFLCDPVRGTAHLRTEESVALQLKEALRKELGGLAMPRFVRDIPDSPCKQDL